jgi:hypothetical protein
MAYAKYFLIDGKYYTYPLKAVGFTTALEKMRSGKMFFTNWCLYRLDVDVFDEDNIDKPIQLESYDLETFKTQDHVQELSKVWGYSHATYNSLVFDKFYPLVEIPRDQVPVKALNEQIDYFLPNEEIVKFDLKQLEIVHEIREPDRCETIFKAVYLGKVIYIREGLDLDCNPVIEQVLPLTYCGVDWINLAMYRSLHVYGQGCEVKVIDSDRVVEFNAKPKAEEEVED